MGNISTQKQALRTLRDKISGHGQAEVQENDLQWMPEQAERTIRAERVLIVLEMLYRRAIDGKGNITAGREYLDRILGKPKENLSLDNAGSPFQSLSDTEIITRVVGIIDRVRERGAQSAQ